MDAVKLCPPPHIEAAELKEKDKDVTIVSVEFAEVGEEKVSKGVVRFEEFDRGMVLNRTNLKRIIKHHGSETDEWTGKKITIYPSETEWKGNTVPCLRVREKK